MLQLVRFSGFSHFINFVSDYQKRFVLHIVLPEVLKEALQDDYEFIAKQQKLMDMPVAKSVKDILEDFSKLTGESITGRDFNVEYVAKIIFIKTTNNISIVLLVQNFFTNSNVRNWLIFSVNSETKAPMLKNIPKKLLNPPKFMVFHIW